MPRRTPKAPKDTNAPKRSLSSYMLFNKQRMQTLRSEQPDKKITELTKVVGADWRAMTAEEKQPFVMEAKEMKDKFNLVMAEYKKSDNFAAFEAKLKAWKISQKENAENQIVDDEDERPAVRAKAQKRPKDSNAPKKPMTGFFIFQTSRRPELKEANPDKKHTDLVKMASEEWRGMTAEQKEPFDAKSRAKKAEYVEALNVYKESEEYAKYQAVLAGWKAAKASAAQKPAKKQAPTRDATESASQSDESDSGDFSSESPPRAQQKQTRKRQFAASSDDDEEDDDSDADMADRNNNSSNGASSSGRDESDSDDESD